MLASCSKKMCQALPACAVDLGLPHCSVDHGSKRTNSGSAIRHHLETSSGRALQEPTSPPRPAVLLGHGDEIAGEITHCKHQEALALPQRYYHEQPPDRALIMIIYLPLFHPPNLRWTVFSRCMIWRLSRDVVLGAEVLLKLFCAVKPRLAQVAKQGLDVRRVKRHVVWHTWDGMASHKTIIVAGRMR
jgi:hypothetical protein